MTFDPDDPIFPPGVPEEFQEQIRERHQHSKLTVQANMHVVRDFLDSLSADQLEALDLVVVNVGSNPIYNCGFVRGEIAMQRWKKFGICPCEEEHDPDKEFHQE